MDTIKYIGTTSPWVDSLTGSGKTWTAGMTANVPDDVGNVARGYPSHFQITDDGGRVTANSSGVYRDDDQSPVSGGGAFGGLTMYDGFGGSLGPLAGRVSDSGHPWVVSGTGVATATAGEGEWASVDNTYAWLDAGAGNTISYIAGSFSLGSCVDPALITNVLIGDSMEGGGLSTMLHLTVSPLGWHLQTRVAAGSFVEIGAGDHNLGFTGAIYSVAMLIDHAAHTVTVIGPSGSETKITNSLIGTTIVCRAGGWQLRRLTNAAECKWHAVGCGPHRPNTRGVPGLSGAAHASDIAALKGVGRTRKTFLLARLRRGGIVC